MTTLPAMDTGFATLLAGSVLLLIVHILTQGYTTTKELGAAWNRSSRDGGERPRGVLAGRAERASANFRETYPGFIALCLALALTGDASGWGMAGALLWFAARVVYLPVYLLGLSPWRSFVWVLSLIGLVVMFVAAVF